MNAPKKCRCVIAHALDPERRAQVVEMVRYQRAIGDATGLMISLAQLQPCPSEGK